MREERENFMSMRRSESQVCLRKNDDLYLFTKKVCIIYKKGGG